MSLNEVQNDRQSPSEILALGPVPPPVTGMTLLTERVLREMQAAGTVLVFDWSPAVSRRRWRMRLWRNVRILASIAWLIARRRRRPGSRLYLVANSSSGLYMTVLAVYVAVQLGYKLYLHHHVYSYIDKHDWRMGLIVRKMGSGTHVVHSEQMISDFLACYPSAKRFVTLAPSIVVTQFGPARQRPREPFRLGLLSNLSLDKGLLEVIETMQVLINRQRDVTLTLAGPISTHEAAKVIENAHRRHPRHLFSLGPVFDNDKWKFFEDIDVLLLPTKSESWGLVLNEALALGVPVISYDRGCVAQVVGSDAGLLIHPAESFASAAADQIERWIDNSASYGSASEAAVKHAECLREQGRRTLNAFTAEVMQCQEASA